jgi:hypothetical protein
MKKVRFLWDYGIDVNIDTEKDVEVYIDKFKTSPPPNGTIRIIIMLEPFDTELSRLVQGFRDCYDYVLTFREEILSNNPKAILFPYGTTWVRGQVPEYKKFCVSTVIGGKIDPRFPGYKLRHEVWRNRDRITIPKDFYLSGRYKWKEMRKRDVPVLGDVKYPLFYSQYHIAIENIRLDNYFTEKLVDCLQTRTVPIYYGCPNIAKYFNPDGMFIIKDINEIVDVCNQLTPQKYEDMKFALEYNYEESNKWYMVQYRIETAIRELINEKI